MFRSDIHVSYVRHMGSDAAIAQSAWVDDPDAPVKDYGDESVGRLIRAMMKGRHGSPFESGALTVYVEAPIFVFREWHRHRIASYNEVSARYRVLEPEFYLPESTRPMMETPEFRPLKPTLYPASLERFATVTAELRHAYIYAKTAYQSLIDLQVGRELARAVLPVGTYSAMYCTMNPRSCLNFLSLRTRRPDALFPSYPQHEIDVAATELERIFAIHWPLTYQAYNDNKRVAP